MISTERNRSLSHRKRLYLLYLLNDLLHHTKYHIHSPLANPTLSKCLEPFLPDLIRLVSVFDPDVFSKHYKKIDTLLSTWTEQSHYSSTYIHGLREIVVNTQRSNLDKTKEESKDAENNFATNQGGEKKNEASYDLPATHGDISTPYYDLPAGNLMLHIRPNTATPINPQLIKPIQMVAGPAEKHLVTAVKSFLNDVDSTTRRDAKYGATIDIDELGQISYRDETTGSLIEEESYYGWSKEFCERMKSRHNGMVSNQRMIGRHDSSERSFSPRKRRRHDYESRSLSRSISTSRSNSSGPRSPSRHERRLHSYQRDRTRSRNRSRSPRTQYNNARAYSGSRPSTRSNSYSPPPPNPSDVKDRPLPEELEPPRSLHALPSPTSNFPHTINQDFAPGLGRVPIPPPPPLNYKGLWPPPPPPHPPPHQLHSSMPPTSFSNNGSLAQPPRGFSNPASRSLSQSYEGQGDVSINASTWERRPQAFEGEIINHPYPNQKANTSVIQPPRHIPKEKMARGN